MNIDPTKITIGQYADYLDTGIWKRDAGGKFIAPDDLTISQLQDFLRMFGGSVYLTPAYKLAWAPPKPVRRRHWFTGRFFSN